MRAIEKFNKNHNTKFESINEIYEKHNNGIDLILLSQDVSHNKFHFYIKFIKYMLNLIDKEVIHHIPKTEYFVFKSLEIFKECLMKYELNSDSVIFDTRIHYLSNILSKEFQNIYDTKLCYIYKIIISLMDMKIFDKGNMFSLMLFFGMFKFYDKLNKNDPSVEDDINFYILDIAKPLCVS